MSVLLLATLGLGEPGRVSAQIPSTETTTVVRSAQQKKRPPGVTNQIQVPESPPAVLQLNADPANPIVNQVVHFTATWNQPVQQAWYHFDWGDNQSSDSASPDTYHSYLAAGPQTASVTAKAIVNDRVIEGRSEGLTLNVGQLPPPRPLPLPTLSANPPYARVGEPVNFTADIDPSVGPPEYHFYFDDGNDVAPGSKEIVHTYTRPGTYHPYVKASLGHGDETVTSHEVELKIDPILPSPPRMTVELLTKDPVAGKTLVLHASLDPPHERVIYSFDWGDRSSPATGGQNGIAIHRYWLPGTYTVEVRASVAGAGSPQLKESRQIVVGLPVGLTVVLAGALAAGVAVCWRFIRQRKKTVPPGTDMRVTPYPGISDYEISLSEQAGPHLSLTLKPGADPEEHRITFL